MPLKLSVFLNSSLLKHNAVFFVGSLTVGALNYLLYPAISRFLSVEEFGEVQVLVNLMVQITILANVVSLFVINVVTNLKDQNEITDFIKNIEGLAVTVSSAGAIALFLASPFIANQLQYNSTSSFWAIAILLVVNVPFSIRLGFLQAKRAFVGVSSAQIIQSALRLALGVIASIIGLSVGGIMFSLVLALLVALVYVSHQSNRLKLDVPPIQAVRGFSLGKVMLQIHKIQDKLSFMILITAVSFTMMFLLSIDTIIAKYFFSPEEAGLYGGLSVVARIIFFLTTSVGGVLATSIKIDNKTQTNLKYLYASLALVILIGGAICLIFAWQPTAIVRLLIGERYEPYAYLLPKLALAVFMLSLTSLMFNYHVAIRDLKLIGVALIGILFTLIFLIVNHHTIDELVNGLRNGIALTLLTTVIWSFIWHYRKKTAA